MLKDLEQLASQALEELDSVNDPKVLEAWRIQYLGKKSLLTASLSSLSTIPVEERRAVGAKVNEIKKAFELGYGHRKSVLDEASLAESLQRKGLDITLPGHAVPVGRLHPTTQALKEICDVFVGMGFQIYEGPEVEWDRYNFEALNIPKDHPARDMWATLWVDYEKDGQRPMLLRTHTSPMQIRIMENTKPPIRAIVPGRVYRYEATDATHESMFYQVEGFAVDKNITMADLKGTLFEFARCLFGSERKARFRCDYFPFVEPGVEMAIDCFVCSGAGCRLCSYSGWIEILGAGMVHPEVLRRVGIDPEEYSGFAFGMGVERIPLLRYGIDDIRLFYGNDLRFLKQF